MNLLGFVFSILTLLAFGAIVAFDKEISARRLHSSFAGHLAAGRHILNSCESEYYASLRTAPKEQEKNPLASTITNDNEPPPPPPPVNPPCARLNLFPLIEKDREKEIDLYETAAKFLRTFYGAALFENKPRAEYLFLNAFLEELRIARAKEAHVSLEKLSLKSPDLQQIYYKMLKGTKRYNPLQNIGYPSLLDYIKLDATPSKICLLHAHPHLLSIFFKPNGALLLYAAIHKKNAPFLNREAIERICQEARVPLLENGWADFFELDPHRHPQGIQTTFLGEDPDTAISIRKVVGLRK